MQHSNTVKHEGDDTERLNEMDRCYLCRTGQNQTGSLLNETKKFVLKSDSSKASSVGASSTKVSRISSKRWAAHYIAFCCLPNTLTRLALNPSNAQRIEGTSRRDDNTDLYIDIKSGNSFETHVRP